MSDLGSKTALKAAIDARIYTNVSFDVSAEDIRSAFEDTIDTLCARNVSFIETTYGDLVNLINTNSLVQGNFYSLEYTCVHRIAGTVVINTASPQYVAAPETFVVKATSENTISPFVNSVEFPNDIILWDYSNDLAEDGSTSRTGKVDYRLDRLSNNSAYYDFRSVLMRFGVADGFSDWVSGNSYTRGDIVTNGATALYRATNDWPTDTEGPTAPYKFVPASPIVGASRWVWSDAASYLGVTVNRDLISDELTFSSCNNCHIGPTSFNDGYNGIKLSSCSSVVLGNESYNGYIESVSDMSITDSFINSVIGVSTGINGNRLSGSYIWSCDDFDFTQISDCDYYGNITVSSKISLNSNVIFSDNSIIGPNFEDNSVHYMQNSVIGANATDNYLRNIQDTDILNSISGNTFSGIRWSKIGNDVRNCDFDAESNQYDVYEHVTIEDRCELLSCDINGNVQKVVFGKGSSNINILAGGNLVRTNIGTNCSNWNIDASAGIYDSNIGASCSTFTLTSSAIISRCEISHGCSDFDLNNGFITDTKIGPNSGSFTLDSSSAIRNSLFGSESTNIELHNGSLIQYCWIGENVDIININNASNVLRSNLGHGGSNFIVDQSSNIEDSIFGANFNGLTFSNGCYVKYSTYAGGNTGITVTNGATLTFVTLAPELSSKTFDTIFLGNYTGGVSASNDSTVQTYGSGASPEDPTSHKDELFETIASAATVSVGFTSNDIRNYYLSNNIDTDINTDVMPANKIYRFVLDNTDAGAHNFTFGANLPVSSQLVINVPATSSDFIQIMRVRGAGGLDKIIQLGSNVSL